MNDRGHLAENVTAVVYDKWTNEPSPTQLERWAKIRPDEPAYEIGQLFCKHRASKCPEHAPLYEQLLGPVRGKEITLLEIGVANGGSLRAFTEFLHNAKVFGVDKQYNAGMAGLHVLMADQADAHSMQAVADLVGPFDVIIDDGGHRANQQQTSHRVLWPYLKPHGVYVIEDLHVAHREAWRSPGYPSTLEYVENLSCPIEFHYCQRFEKDICVMRKEDRGRQEENSGAGYGPAQAKG